MFQGEEITASALTLTYLSARTYIPERDSFASRNLIDPCLCGLCRNIQAYCKLYELKIGKYTTERSETANEFTGRQ